MKYVFVIPELVKSKCNVFGNEASSGIQAFAPLALDSRLRGNDRNTI